MNAETNFWINDNIFDENISIDIRKEWYRSAVKNFVKIVTQKDVPVQYRGEKNQTDGKTIWINESFDLGSLDSTVGIILHESCHIIHSDFDLIKTLWMKIPREATQLAKTKKIDVNKIPEVYRKLLNYVEDRFIDNWAYNEFIGYRGYYQDLYKRFWNNRAIGEALESRNYRDETYNSYMFRIINLTNKSTDLYALKGLKRIYDIIDLENINRLTTPKDRLNIASRILIELLNHIDDIDPDEKFTGDGDNLSDTCHKWLDGDYKPVKGDNTKEPKSSDTDHDGEEMDSDDFKLDDNIKCVFIKKVNSENITSLNLPISKYASFSKGNIGISSVNQGIILGKVLANKWKIRGEVNKTIINRQPSGKIDRRMLYSVGVENDKIFYRTKIELFKRTHIHISIDASGSMSQNQYGKWKNSIICAVAIAKAASITENVEVVITVRTTIEKIDDVYPCLVVLYDSRKDRFNKIYSLFPLIHPGGSTPEGLLFPLISTIIPESNHEIDSFFINFTDGIPHFRNEKCTFSGIPALIKTNFYFNKLKKDKNINPLCYYIGECDLEKVAFQRMYEKDSFFIDVKDIINVSKTITKKVLQNKKTL